MATRRTDLLVRAGLALLAVGVAVWLALGLGAARPQAEGRSLTRGGLDEQRYREALARFREAQPNNPDTDPELLEGGLLLAAGRPREAARVVEEVVREEPENSKAWALLAGAAARFDPAREAEARRELDRLKPRVGR